MSDESVGRRPVLYFGKPATCASCGASFLTAPQRHRYCSRACRGVRYKGPTEARALVVGRRRDRDRLLIEGYCWGLPVKELAQQVGLSRQAVYDILDVNNIPRRGSSVAHLKLRGRGKMAPTTLYIFFVDGLPRPATDLTRHLYEHHPAPERFDTMEAFRARYLGLLRETVQGDPPPLNANGDAQRLDLR